MSVVVGIDLSLTSTGLAMVNTTGIEPHVQITRVASSGTKTATLVERQLRLVSIGTQVVGFAHGYTPDLVVIEAPSFASKYGHPHDRSGLWWLVVNSLLAQGYPVAQAPPKCRAKYATGNGNAGKDDVLTDVVRRYPEVPISKNDEADALVLASMGARHLGRPLEASLPQTHLAGLNGVEWPGS
jgi:crossover junction endodeoxyribonuclease RuvC